MGRPKGPHTGHQLSRGLMAWQKVHAESLKNRKHFVRTKESWTRFKATAGIHGGLSVAGALAKLNAAGCPIERRTLTNWIAGFTDVKLSTAIDASEVWGIGVDGFARAMLEAWEVAERRWATEQAIAEALR